MRTEGLSTQSQEGNRGLQGVNRSGQSLINVGAVVLGNN